MKWITLVFIFGAIMMLGACKKKAAPPPPPPPPPPPSPTASISANPNSIDKGMSTTLSWQTTNATDVSVDGIGAVQPNGSQQVTPTDSTTYHLVAKGAGGTQEATARVTVNAPPPPPPAASLTDEELFARNVKDIYFDFLDATVVVTRNVLSGLTYTYAHYFVTAGIAANRIRTISYGKEKPFCSEATEACWQQNRRAGFGMAN